ncbi:MAG TPA: Stk1 family PASTA domain-containing Ser/Thr kinase [Acidimicrobiia bacterium]|nr:Stk1 family PASTA domain-containing Ser/Thr kinase [Acidimicrobiia bacterium]
MQLPHDLTERYQLTAHLARGGMADVYQGHDRLLNRKVAVKVLHSQLSDDDAFVKRFRKEAQAAANLTHPNIVGIYDWGQLDNTYFIVMELVEGRSLRDVLKSEGTLLPRRAVEIAADVSAALSVAHRAGLVHRDVKPGNILLSPDGTVKVTDFGIARAWDDSQELTRTGAVMGTATYFSPEQAQGSTADERSDVYSVGVVLYEMLAGSPPFRGDNPMAVAYQHVSQPPVPPSTVNPDVPGPLDDIVLTAMAKSPDERYQTAEEMRQDLWAALQGRAPAAVAPAAHTGMAMAGEHDATRMMTRAVPPATAPPDQGYRVLEEPPSSNLAFVVGTFALLITLGVLVFLVVDLLSGTDTSVTETVEVPEVVGLSAADAIRRLGQFDLIGIPEEVNDDSVAPGIVVRSDPEQGEAVEPNSEVILFVSAGAALEEVPFLEGMELAAAEDTIVDRGFRVGTIREEPSDSVEDGIVIRQNPPANTPMPPGTPIDLVVSTGPDSVTLDDLSGLTQRDATARLDTLGLTYVFETEYSNDVDRGRVIRTDPGPGSLPPGFEVLVVISDGVEPIPVPSLLGMDEATARAQLEALGLVLEVNNSTIEVSDPTQVGLIQAQNPTQPAVLFPGDIVRVTLGAAPQTTTTTIPPETTTTTTEPPPSP